jgi:hypothetical protein
MKIKSSETCKKVLIISYPFPPIPYSGSYRIVRMCKGLIRLGIDVSVLSIPIDNRIPNDYDLLAKIPEEVNVFRQKIFDPWLAYQYWYRRKEKTKTVKAINKLGSNLLKLITIPDHQIFWIPTAFKKAKMIIAQHGIDTVMVSSPPISTLFIGYLLKKRKKIKFLADFRDPVVGNIAAVNLIDPKDIISKIEKTMLRLIEKAIVKNADYLIANTLTHKKELTEKYGIMQQVQTVKNCYDEDDFKFSDTEQFDKFTISHLGSIYGLRNADILFHAIKDLADVFGHENFKLQVRLVGQTDASLQKSIERHGVEKYVVREAPVSHQEAIKVMVKSHLLLLLKASGKGSLGQIPAKFYEYLGAEKTILCIGPENSEVAGMIESLKAGYTIENDKEKLVAILNKLYEDYLNEKKIPLIDRRGEDFTLSSMSKKVAELL